MIPNGYKQIEDAEVFVKENQLVICGTPDEDNETHNCDEMGCSSISHVLFRTTTDFTPDYTELVQRCSDVIFKMMDMLPDDSYVEGLEEVREELNNVLGID